MAVSKYYCIFMFYCYRTQLNDHFRSDHPSPDWKCYKCGNKLKDRCGLSNHMYRFHHEGRFGCVVEQCDFVATTRQAVVNHHNNSHCRFRCSFEGCGKPFYNSCHLKDHERGHSGARPFRCKWEGCGKDFSTRSHIHQHIRGEHLKSLGTRKQQEGSIVDNRDPRQFVEVIQELL